MERVAVVDAEQLLQLAAGLADGAGLEHGERDGDTGRRDDDVLFVVLGGKRDEKLGAEGQGDVAESRPGRSLKEEELGASSRSPRWAADRCALADNVEALGAAELLASRLRHVLSRA